MDNIMKILDSSQCILVMAIAMVILILIVIIMMFKFSILNKRYQNFMKKIGKNSNIEEDLQAYMYKVTKVEKQNDEILSQIKNLDEGLEKCIQKVGIVRYNAFKDTGSDLSFTLALLDENNDGVVLNGIYSREMSNIYAKPVKNGKSKYTVSDEEQQAIEKAISSNEIVK